MNSSLKLLSVSGIDIRMHITFPLILIFAAFQFGFLSGAGVTGALFGVIVVSLLFVLVTLHELGHSFAARYYGIPVEQIVLLPIGGVAQLKSMSRKPIQEFVIAIAGPAVNVAIALLMIVIAPLIGINFTNPLALITGGISLTLTTILGYLFYYNVALAVFNMLPAFPMDGGRVLRALLAMRLPYGKATKYAVNVGRGLAILMGIYGLVGGGIFLILIAFFIYAGASQELRAVAFYDELAGYRVSDAFTSQALVLSPYDNLQRAMSLKMTGMQSGFPVVYAGQLVGYLSDEALLAAVSEKGLWAMVRDAMSKNINPVSLHNPLYDVQERMQQEQTNSFPVVDGTQFLGMISYRQIREFIKTMRMNPDWVSQAQSA